MKTIFAAALAVAITACTPVSASAYVFKEPPEPGLEIKIPSWTEHDKGKVGDMFADLGGQWEAYFSSSSKTTLNVEVVKADTTKYPDAQAWVKQVVIAEHDTQQKDSFMSWYAGDYTWSYDKLVETPAKLQSGEPVIVTTYTNLKINGVYPKVAYITFGRGVYWYCLVVFNDKRGRESIDDAVRSVLSGTAFIQAK